MPTLPGSLMDGLVLARMTFVALLTGAVAAPAAAQSCNPVIDGTYCDTANIRRPNASPPTSPFAPMQNIARDIGPSTDQPATLGGITFRGNQTCIGLMRRGACS
jgi:hypothetical protein